MTDESNKQDEALKRRGDNVGQSGRWAHGAPKEAGERRYGHEERWHSSDHPGGVPHEEEPDRQPNADKPGATPYEGSADEGEEQGDDKARYPARSYGDAGGREGGDKPKHPDQQWKEEGGAGFGEKYGARKEARDASKKSG